MSLHSVPTPERLTSMSISGTCGMHCLRQQPTSQNQQDKKGEGGSQGQKQPASQWFVQVSSTCHAKISPERSRRQRGGPQHRHTKSIHFFPLGQSLYIHTYTYVHVVTRGSDPPGWRECCKLLPGTQWQKSVILLLLLLLLLLLCPAKPVLCCLNNTGRSTLGAFSRRSFWSKTLFGLSETAVATYFPRASCVRGGGGSFGSEIEWLAGIAARDVRRPMCVLGRAEFQSPYHRVGKRKVGPKKKQ